MKKAGKVYNTSTQSRQKPPRNSILEDAVSHKLKAYYAEMEHQEMPKNLLELLDKLDKAVN
jgi:DNA-binding protein Fis